VGTVSNIPLRPDNSFFLLFLCPPDRSAIFQYELPSKTRARGIVEVNEKGEVAYHEVQEFQVGGGVVCDIVADEYQISDASKAKLQRIVQAQYTTWDDMRILDRINLQITWATDAIKRAEEDLMYVIENPRDDIQKGCWDTGGLLDIIDTIERWQNHRQGLVMASEAL